MSAESLTDRPTPLLEVRHGTRTDSRSRRNGIQIGAHSTCGHEGRSCGRPDLRRLAAASEELILRLPVRQIPERNCRAGRSAAIFAPEAPLSLLLLSPVHPKQHEYNRPTIRLPNSRLRIPKLCCTPRERRHSCRPLRTTLPGKCGPPRTAAPVLKSFGTAGSNPQLVPPDKETAHTSNSQSKRMDRAEEPDELPAVPRHACPGSTARGRARDVPSSNSRSERWPFEPPLPILQNPTRTRT